MESVIFLENALIRKRKDPKIKRVTQGYALYHNTVLDDVYEPDRSHGTFWKFF